MVNPVNNPFSAAVQAKSQNTVPAYTADSDTFAALISASTPTAANISAPSAASGSGGTPPNTLLTDFTQWLAQVTSSGSGAGGDYQKAVEADAPAFEQIMNKAAANNGFTDPQAFVSSLSTSELSVLQTIHSLADPINPATLTKEGALNLLEPPNNAQDIDNDGYEMVGIAKMWHFPPPNAPDTVKQAWDATIANMDGGDRLTLMASFMPGINIDGSAANAYISPNADYASLTQRVIEGLQNSLQYNGLQQQQNIENQMGFLQKFIDELKRYNAA